MANVRKFLFDTSFDAPEAPEEPAVDPVEEVEPEPVPEPPPPPTYSEADLAAARAEAEAAGREEGLNEAGAGVERRAAAALEAITTRLDGLAQSHAETQATLQREAAAVAIAVARKMLPELARRNGLNEIERAVEDAMGLILEEPRVTIRVAEAMLDAVRGGLTDLVDRSGFEGRLSIAGDPAMADGDCRIDWSAGGAERDTEALWRDIDEIIVRNLGPPDSPAAPVAAPAAAPEPDTGQAPAPDTETGPDTGPDTKPSG